MQVRYQLRHSPIAAGLPPRSNSGILATRVAGCEIGGPPACPARHRLRRRGPVVRRPAAAARRGARPSELAQPQLSRPRSAAVGVERPARAAPSSADLQAGAVRHHDAGLPRRQRGQAVAQRRHHPGGHLGSGLGARDDVPRAGPQPGGVLLGELARANSARVMPWRGADVVLAQPRVGRSRPSPVAASTYAAVCARPGAGRWSTAPPGASRGQVRRRRGGLRVPDRRRADVGVALGAALGFQAVRPCRSRTSRRAPRPRDSTAPRQRACAGSTSAGSGDRCGQSRHSRSRA